MTTSEIQWDEEWL